MKIQIYLKKFKYQKSFFFDEISLMISPSQIKEGGFFVIVGKKLE